MWAPTVSQDDIDQCIGELCSHYGMSVASHREGESTWNGPNRTIRVRLYLGIDGEAESVEVVSIAGMESDRLVMSCDAAKFLATALRYQMCVRETQPRRWWQFWKRGA